ncbi:MAG TPA: SPOR domain-containing protein [Rubricoccaceae bacterium]|jgi:uncharacterized protein involved in copper resistance
MLPPRSAARLSAHAVAVLVLGMALAACSGTRPASGPAGPAAPPDATPAAYPAYETFDASPYDAAPPGRVEITHDVPAGVMAGRVNVPAQAGAPAPSEPSPRQVEGYRVQIFSSSSRAAAEQTRDGAVAWWTRTRGRSGAPAALDPLVAYLQPYYRVRLGAFATEEEAEAALAFVRSEYPEAFLVPDVVTVVE